MVFHPGWAYFAKDYDLEEIPIEIGGTEPSASELAALIDTAKSRKYPCDLCPAGVQHPDRQIYCQRDRRRGDPDQQSGRELAGKPAPGCTRLLRSHCNNG